MKKRILIFLTVILALLLCACSNRIKNVKDESAIQADLETHEYMYSNCPIEITKVEVLRRQTNKENRTDTVYVSVESKTPYSKRSDGWVIEYGLYDDIGWDYNSHYYYVGYETTCTVVSGPAEDDVNKWFELYNDSTQSLQYYDWTICSSDFNDATALVECTAKSTYTLPALGVELINEEVVLINFFLDEYGSRWDCGIRDWDYLADWDYIADVKDVSFSSPVSAVLYGKHDGMFSRPTKSNYEFGIDALEIEYKDGYFDAYLDAYCDSYEYVYFGYGYSDEWNCYDFAVRDVSVTRDRIRISGMCRDDHIRTTYDLLFNNEDIDVWYDSGYDENEYTEERVFTITLSPGEVSVSIDGLNFK